MKKYLFIFLVSCGVQELIMQAGGACSSMGERPPSSPRASSYEVPAGNDVAQYAELTDFQALAANSSIEPTKTRDSDEESAAAESSPDEAGVLTNSLSQQDPFEVAKEEERKKKKEEVVVLASLKQSSKKRHTHLSSDTARRLTRALQNTRTQDLGDLHDASTVKIKPKNIDVFRVFKDGADALKTYREEENSPAPAPRKISGANEGDRKDEQPIIQQAPPRIQRRDTVIVTNLD